MVNIFDFQGNFLQRFVDFTDWDWHPNGDLILVRDNEIHRASANSANTSIIATMTEKVRHISVSPDGNYFAFSMNNEVWRTDNSGNNPRQLTISREGTMDPIWAPDGSAVIVELIRSFNCNSLHVVPADGSRVPIGYDAIQASTFKVYQQIDGTRSQICPDNEVQWR